MIFICLSLYVLNIILLATVAGYFVCGKYHYDHGLGIWDFTTKRVAAVASLPLGSFASIFVAILVAHAMPSCSLLMLGLVALLTYGMIGSILVLVVWSMDNGSGNVYFHGDRASTWVGFFISALLYAGLLVWGQPVVPTDVAIEVGFWSMGTVLVLGVLCHANIGDAITKKQQQILVCLVCISCFLGSGVRFVPIIYTHYSHMAANKALAVTISDMETRLNDSLPQYQQSLTLQVVKIQKLRAGASVRSRALLDIELREIATALLAVEKFEAQCKDTHMELLSMRRKLERTHEADSVLGISYEELLTLTRETVEKASLKLSVKIDSIAGMDGISQAEIDRKVYQLIESGK